MWCFVTRSSSHNPPVLHLLKINQLIFGANQCLVVMFVKPQMEGMSDNILGWTFDNVQFLKIDTLNSEMLMP